MKISEMNDTEKLLYTLETMKAQRDLLLAAAKKVWLFVSQFDVGPRGQKSLEALRQAIAECEKP